MPDMPAYRTVKRTRHEWAIPVPCDAKTFELGIHHAKREAQALGLQMTSDDAYFVTVTDDEVVIYIEVEKPK